MINARLMLAGIALMGCRFLESPLYFHPGPTGRTPLPRAVREKKKHLRQISKASRRRNQRHH